MGSNGKKKTTMAKLNRETRMRERREEKAARKEARKAEAANPTMQVEEHDADTDVEADLEARQVA